MIDLTWVNKYLYDEGCKWVIDIKNQYEEKARNLTFKEKDILKNWFTNNILNTAKVAEVNKVENPSFLIELKKKLPTVPINFDYSSFNGVTFDYVILMAIENIKEQEWMPTLFHELVHVVQFDILGLSNFVQLYVDDAVNTGFNYREISLEKNAYNLQSRFESSPISYFSIEEEVRKHLSKIRE